MEISRSNVSGGGGSGGALDDSFSSFRTELLSPAAQAVVDQSSSSASWRLNISEFRLPERSRSSSDHHTFSVRRLLPTPSMYVYIYIYYIPLFTCLYNVLNLSTL